MTEQRGVTYEVGPAVHDDKDLATAIIYEGVLVIMDGDNCDLVEVSKGLSESKMTELKSAFSEGHLFHAIPPEGN